MSFRRPGNEARVGGEDSSPTPSLFHWCGQRAWGETQLAVPAVWEQTADVAGGRRERGGVYSVVEARHASLDDDGWSCCCNLPGCVCEK